MKLNLFKLINLVFGAWFLLLPFLVFGQSTSNQTTLHDFSNTVFSPNQFEPQPINAPGETYISNVPASSGVFIPEQYRSFITSPGLSTGPAEFAPPAITSIQSNPPPLSTSIVSQPGSPNDGSAPSRSGLLTKGTLDNGQISYQPPLGCGPEGNGYRLCVPLLGVSFIENDLAGYINLIYRFVLGIAGLIVFGVIVYAGIQYTISAGSPGLAGDALDMIKQAIIGLILLFLSYIILNTINPAIVHLKNPEVQSSVLPSEEQQRQLALDTITQDDAKFQKNYDERNAIETDQTSFNSPDEKQAALDKNNQERINLLNEINQLTASHPEYKEDYAYLRERDKLEQQIEQAGTAQEKANLQTKIDKLPLLYDISPALKQKLNLPFKF